jgi:hypothetical protein
MGVGRGPSLKSDISESSNRRHSVSCLKPASSLPIQNTEIVAAHLALNLFLLVLLADIRVLL